MKKLLRVFIIESVSVYIASQIARGLVFEKGILGIAATGFALAIASIFVKPIINLLLIPINLITFNLFRFVENAIILYLVSLVVTQFKITGFFFAGIDSPLISLPEISLTTPILYFSAFSILISTISGLLHWLVK